MTVLLFPGRHHLLTCFQHDCMLEVLRGSASGRRDLFGRSLEARAPIDTVVWAVTSANHSNTRRNPLPANRREVAIENFARDLPAKSFVYLVEDVGESPRFAEYILKKIEVESGGRFRLTPENTVVGCSTPEVIELYRTLGFLILPFELEDIEKGTFRARTPWELVQAMVAAGRSGEGWEKSPAFLEEVAPASQELFRKYRYGDLLIRLHDDPLLGADGDLTETRDYNTYIRSFDAGAKRKYRLIRDHVRPGRIVDIGCCTGSLIREMTLDDRLRESDFYGIEVASQLYRECVHRKEQGHFANDNVFFYHRNITREPLFPDHSVDTFLTLSLTHEIESYQGRATLERFMSQVHRQLSLSGCWINLDVVGPEKGGEEVLLKLSEDDGRNDDFEKTFSDGEREAFRDYLDGLSTRARLLRFARDFRQVEGYRMPFEEIRREGEVFFRLRLEDAAEFLSKKDYTDNWLSEMHERFCFWSFAEWKKAAERAGFEVDPASRAFTNSWLVRERYLGKAALYREKGGSAVPLDYPATNMLLVCRRGGAP